MNIKILGTGCAKCQALGRAVQEAVDELQVEATVEELKDMQDILKYPILITPGLVINEKVVSSGQVLTKEKIKQLIAKAQEKER